MEKSNEKLITISEEKLNLINDRAYAELTMLNLIHGCDLDIARILEENHKYGKLLISIMVDSTDESEE